MEEGEDRKYLYFSTYLTSHVPVEHAYFRAVRPTKPPSNKSSFSSFGLCSFTCVDSRSYRASSHSSLIRMYATELFDERREIRGQTNHMAFASSSCREGVEPYASGQPTFGSRNKRLCDKEEKKSWKAKVYMPHPVLSFYSPHSWAICCNLFQRAHAHRSSKSNTSASLTHAFLFSVLPSKPQSVPNSSIHFSQPSVQKSQKQRTHVLHASAIFSRKEST
jgi:hypothetical protein